MLQKLNYKEHLKCLYIYILVVRFYYYFNVILVVFVCILKLIHFITVFEKCDIRKIKEKLFNIE